MKMPNWLKVLTILFLGILLVISNILTPNIGLYHFQDATGKFEYSICPAKGQTVDHMEKTYAEYKEQNPGYDQDQLYRTFKRNWFKFWNWLEYLEAPRYDYPYRKKNRSNKLSKSIDG